MKKSEFLDMVQIELDTIKQNATQEEINKLNFDSFNFCNASDCIYGQMTGKCNSDRAKQLYPKSFALVYNLASINETNRFKQQSLNKGDFYTPLEKYLFMVRTNNGYKSKKHKEVIDYLKNEITEIEL